MLANGVVEPTSYISSNFSKDMERIEAMAGPHTFSDSNFDDEIDWSLNFRDPALQSKYGMFKVFASSQSDNTYISAGLTLLIGLYWLWELCFGEFTRLTGYALFLTVLVVFIPLWLSAGLRRIVLVSSQTALIQKLLTILESCIIICLATSLAWTVFSTAELETFMLYQRQPLVEPGGSFKCLVVASFAGQLLFFLPILAPIFFTFASWRAVIAMSAIAFICTICAAIAFSTKAAVLRLISFTVLAYLIQYSGRMQQMRLFRCMAKYNESLETRAQESHVAGVKLKEETRNMVASFCHDTKTPLAALAAGIETVIILLSNLKNDMQAKSTGRQNDTAVIKRSMDSFESTIAHMNATFQLTLMAVNRAADYAKAKYDMDLGPIFETFHLQLAIADVVSHIRSLFAFENIHAEAMPEEIASFIITDRNWLIEGLMELSLNAIKYSSDNKAILRVQLVQGSEMIAIEGMKKSRHDPEEEYYDGEQFLRFAVENNGEELNKQEIESAFLPTDFSKQRDAGGLKAGLYCLSKRCTALGGCCGMTTLANGGSGMRAWFTIPYRATEPPMKDLGAFRVESVDTMAWESGDGVDHIASFSTEDITFNPDDFGIYSIRVLIVDDAVTITKMIAKQFKHAGYYVETATNGQEALIKVFASISKSTDQSEEEKGKEGESCSFELKSAMKCSFRSAEMDHPEPERYEKNYDVILMDLQMPIMDGFTAIREIRARELDSDRYRHLIIAMSANSDQGTVVDAYAAGADYFLQKPCKLLSVQQLLREYFTRRMRESEGAPELQL